MSDYQRPTSQEGMSGSFISAVEVARERLKEIEPEKRAAEIGAKLVGNLMEFTYLGQTARVTIPCGECFLDDDPATGIDSVLLLHYVLDAGPIKPTGSWISYREIPDSSAYFAAYQARGPGLIAQRYGEDPAGFEQACLRIGGRRDPELPGLAYVIRALPRFPLAIILYEGEPGLPPEAQILFDATAPSMWVAEDLAVLGEITAVRL